MIDYTKLAQQIFELDEPTPEEFSEEEVINNIKNDLKAGRTTNYINQLTNLIAENPNLSEELTPVLNSLNEIPKAINPKYPQTRQDWDKLSINEVEDLLTQQLEQINFDDVVQRQNFFKFMSGMNRTNNYSPRNQMLILLQDYARLDKTLFDEPSIHGTSKDWKDKGYYIKKGEHASIIARPIISTYYYDNETKEMLPKTYSKQELEEREKKVLEGSIFKKEYTSFINEACIFNIDQINISEDEKAKLLGTYLKHNTSEENKELLPKLEALCDSLGIKYNDNVSSWDMSGANGSMNYNTNELKIAQKNNDFTDFKIGVITHEIGHWMLHRHLQSVPQEETIPRHQREVQAELFSCLALESLGITSEIQNSMKYIKGWQTAENNHDDIYLQQEDKNEILQQLYIVRPAQKIFSETICSKEINAQQMKDFIPDRLIKDTETNKYKIEKNGWKALIKSKEKKGNEKDAIK